MDPATAENLANYTFTARGRARTNIELSSAVYDPATRTVRLTASQPFMQTEFRQLEVRVKGKAGGVTDIAGNLLDGIGRGARAATPSRASASSPARRSRHRPRRRPGTLTIDNGGRLDGIMPLQGQAVAAHAVLDPRPDRAAQHLSGTVTRARRATASS